MKLRRREDDEPVLNLTPMIDVVFQLLVFFMVATTFLDPERAIEIALPEASAGEPITDEIKELVINVFADGRMVVGGQDVDDAQLLQTLKAAALSDPDTPVTIRGDGQARHERIVQVMDACQRAGLTQFNVGTLEGS